MNRSISETLMARTPYPRIDPRDLECAPLARAQTIPSRWYTDPAFHALEREWIFTRTWQGIGHTSKLRQPGDYIIGNAAENPIIVVRGRDRRLHGFYNVCRHRGGPLALCDGHARALQCKYHGWTYLLDGMLRGVPEFDRVELFDRKDYGLIPVRVAEWQGLVFVHLQESPPPLAEIVAGISERIAPARLETLTFHQRVVYDVHCNWKVYVDNYLEGYHLPYVHPELCTLLDYRQYVTETFTHYSLQYSPFAGEENIYGAAGGQAFYFFIFPNFMLNILPGRLQTNLVVPVDHERASVIFDYYYADVDSAAAREMIAADLAYSDKVQQEDIEICEHVQRGLASRAYDRGRFSVKRESGVYHFQCLLKQAYRRMVEAGS